MKLKPVLTVMLVGGLLSLATVGQAKAAAMNAGAAITGTFLSSWTSGHPDIFTTSVLDFKTTTVNTSLDPKKATGDFAWTGSEKDYTMDIGEDSTHYAGHIGEATNSLSVGNQTFNPSGNGKDFLTWHVDIFSLGGVHDKIHFDLTSEQILSKTTVGNTKSLALELFGNVWDDSHHWSSTVSSLTLTVSETVSGSNYTYSWASAFSAPSAGPGGGGSVPEPSTMLLLGLGLGLTLIMAKTARIRYVRA